jgi:hypothetical protein
MKHLYRVAILSILLTLLAGLASAQDAKKPAAPAPANAQTMVKALENAMTPGPGQKKLDAMVGTFDVAIKTWPDPAKPPVESKATCINTWVLGNRYVQMSLAGYVGAEMLTGIGYMAYDNTAKVYEATWMDTGSTGMVWYKGGFDPAGKMATMKASVPDPVTGKPTPLELRVTIDDKGGHVTEMWGTGSDGKMFKMMELRYTRTK